LRGKLSLFVFREKGPERLKQLEIVIAGVAVLIKVRFQRALSRVDGCLVVGAAIDEDAAVALICSIDPDVVILDIRMPHKNGIGVLKEINHRNPSSVIIMFTADESVILRDACLEAGAGFYLNKSQMTELLNICRQQLAEKSERDL
jgi:two-component system response regulator DevR